MSWQEVHRIQQLESQVRKLEDRLAALEARFTPPEIIWGKMVDFTGKEFSGDIELGPINRVE